MRMPIVMSTRGREDEKYPGQITLFENGTLSIWARSIRSTFPNTATTRRKLRAMVARMEAAAKASTFRRRCLVCGHGVAQVYKEYIRHRGYQCCKCKAMWIDPKAAKKGRKA